MKEKTSLSFADEMTLAGLCTLLVLSVGSNFKQYHAIQDLIDFSSPKNIRASYVNNDTLQDLVFTSEKINDIYLQQADGSFVAYDWNEAQERQQFDSLLEQKQDSMQQKYFGEYK
jgi:hypothetical protein